MAKETSDPATWHWTAADKLFLELVRQAHAREHSRDHRRRVQSHGPRFLCVRRSCASSRPSRRTAIGTSCSVSTIRPRRRTSFATRAGGASTRCRSSPTTKRATIFTRARSSTSSTARARWMDPNGDGDPADGIDGWRLDVANEVPTGFWRDWHEHARQINPECYTVAEVWDDARQLPRRRRLLGDDELPRLLVSGEGLFDRRGARAERRGAASWTSGATAIRAPMQYALQNLMDSHDTDRLASMIVNAGRRPYAQPDRFDYDIDVSPRYVPDYDVRKPNDRERRVQRLVALLQMTYVGPPMIYYGTEAGMWGADDPCDRMPMVWPELTYEPQQADPLTVSA